MRCDPLLLSVSWFAKTKYLSVCLLGVCGSRVVVLVLLSWVVSVMLLVVVSSYFKLRPFAGFILPFVGECERHPIVPLKSTPIYH